LRGEQEQAGLFALSAVSAMDARPASVPRAKRWPVTGEPALAIPGLTVVLQPRPSNGCKKVSDLLPQNLTCVAKTRITAVTSSRITAAELQQLRQFVVLTIGGLS